MEVGKINYPEKFNTKPVDSPSTQFAAEEIKEIKDKFNSFLAAFYKAITGNALLGDNFNIDTLLAVLNTDSKSVIKAINENLISINDIKEALNRLNTGQTAQYFLTQADATAYWEEQNTAGTPPEETFKIEIGVLKEYHVFDATDTTHRTVKVGNVLQAEDNPVEGSNNVVKSGGVYNAIEAKASLTTTINFFDKNLPNENLGKYVKQSDGTKAVSGSYNASLKIYIPDGETQVMLSIGRQMAFFNDSEAYISGDDGVGEVNRLISIPGTAEYLECSVPVAEMDSFMVTFGSEIPSRYYPFKVVQRDLLQITNEEIVEPIKESNIGKDAISTDKIKKGSVTAEKTEFMTKSLNEFDINDADIVVGKYLDSSGNPVSTNASYNTSGFIDVRELDNGEPIYGLTAQNGLIFRYYAFFDENKILIPGSRNQDLAPLASIPKFDDAVYFRHSYQNNNTEIMISFEEITKYVPFGYSLQDSYIENNNNFKKLNSILGKNASIATFSSVLSTEEKTLDNFPLHLKKGLSMSISCEFTSFTGYVEFGKGREETNGDWIRIDDTNIYWYSKGSSTNIKGTYAHGLTISTYINASLSINDLGEFYVTLQSLGGLASTDFINIDETKPFRFEANYEPFIYTSGQDLINVKLTATSKEFQHPVWVFTDSYGGVVENRWPGQMKDIGYFNFLLNGLSGQVSSLAYAELLRCLKHGTPQFLLWLLGMNDTDLGYQNVLDDLIILCEENNITLILATIPTVPTRNKETIKTIVESSGYRYVDCYKAVGADETGTWYAGYLDGDGVHTTNLGAKGIASRILVDVPELMQYGII